MLRKIGRVVVAAVEEEEVVVEEEQVVVEEEQVVVEEAVVVVVVVVVEGEGVVRLEDLLFGVVEKAVASKESDVRVVTAIRDQSDCCDWCRVCWRRAQSWLPTRRLRCRVPRRSQLDVGVAAQQRRATAQ